MILESMKQPDPSMYASQPFGTKFIKVPLNEDFDLKGKRSVALYFNMPLGLLNLGTDYQRSIQMTRIAQLTKMIKERNSFLMEMMVFINMTNDVVDGSHRTVVSRNLNLPFMPLVMQCEFRTFEDEAEYFIDINRINTQINKAQYVWRALKKANHTTGNLLYQLCDDSTNTSALYNYVSIAERPSHKNRISIDSFWKILYKVAFNKNSHWKMESDSYTEELINEVGYDHIESCLNEFMTWFKLCFGEKKGGHIAWRPKALSCFARIFNMLKQQNLIETSRPYQASIKKFNRMVLNADAIKGDEYVLLGLLVNHFNKGKQGAGNKIVMPM